MNDQSNKSIKHAVTSRDNDGALRINFDKAVAEEKANAITVSFDGEDYPLPHNAPAWLPLFINEHSDENGVVDNRNNLKMIKQLLGKGFAEKITDEANNFVSMDLVNNEILKPVMDHWGVEDFNDETEIENGNDQFYHTKTSEV